MFGRYDYSLAIDDGILKLGVEKRAGLNVYYRDLAGDHKEKVLGPESAPLVIHPVEPISVPKQVTLFLEISFDSVLLGPTAKKTIFLTFPIEIGVFLEAGSATEMLDTFSYLPSKFSLYGTPKTGVITKWYRSRVYSDAPTVDMKKEGVLRLEIENTTKDFAEVARAVFEANGMVLYFDQDQVGMNAQMTIKSSLTAETSFFECPYQEGMEKAIELRTAKKIPIVGGHKIIRLSGVEVNVFVMEAGYS
ncbi:MAG: DUF432 domain-containing protein [Methanomicrobiales archaeon]|nr:DUF432 domain-containing protein [Methanomicrobiales archaeon]